MPSACWRMCARMSVLLRPSIAVERKQRQNWCGHDRVSRPPRKKSADLGSSRCEVDIKRVYDAVIRPGNLSNAGLILPTCRPPRKKSADLGGSRCEVDIKRVYDAVIRPGNLSNAGLILPTCRLFRLSLGLN